MVSNHLARGSPLDTSSHERTRSIPPGILSQSKESLAKVLTGLALDLPKTRAPIPCKNAAKNFNKLPQRSKEAPGRILTTVKPAQQNIKKDVAIRTNLLAPRSKTPDNLLNKQIGKYQIKQPKNVSPLVASVKVSKEQLPAVETAETTKNRSEVKNNTSMSRQVVPPKAHINPTSAVENNSSARTSPVLPSFNSKQVANQSVPKAAHATTIIKTNVGGLSKFIPNNSALPQQPKKSLPRPLLRTKTLLSILPQTTKADFIDQQRLPFNTQINLARKIKRNSIGSISFSMPVQAKSAMTKLETNELSAAKPRKKVVKSETNETTLNTHLSNEQQAHSEFVFTLAFSSVTMCEAALIDLVGNQRKLAIAKIVPDANRQKRLRNKSARPAKMTIKAVFFDLYGVYVRYLDNEAALTLIRKIVTTPSLREKIFDYERGKWSCEECLDVVSIVHPPLKDADNLENVNFWDIVAGVDENIKKAVVKLRENGYKIPDDLSLFDVVIESCKTGYRKSDAEIYWIAAESLGLECHECVLVDDSLLNVHGALDQGMYGIKQHGEDSKSAIQELENLLYVRLH
ncbi:Acyl-CoA dehydrogenase family member 10 [Aphelenchoides bicaudatus]|nr:Acyl-CoA dehydrogenase family member 10 [Aphelenchoides bicaudatus]